MPADYEASRQRDRRFARRFLFVMLCLDGALLGLAGSLALATGATGLIEAWTATHSVILFVLALGWVSGKILK